MKVEKPEWLKLKELHDAEEIEVGGGFKRPRSRGAVYNDPDNSRVDQVGDGYIDVNQIMKRFEKLPTAAELQAAGLTAGGFYADFISAPDFEQALQISNAAKAQFALLPAAWRAHFDHDPSKFLQFVTDPKNEQEVISMGLKVKKPTPEPEITLKDVRDAITTAAKPKKAAGKGGEDEG